jgi:organic hydroperoxide reductase OsmC/OhrA
MSEGFVYLNAQQLVISEGFETNTVCHYTTLLILMSTKHIKMQSRTRVTTSVDTSCFQVLFIHDITIRLTIGNNIKLNNRLQYILY